MSYLLYCLCLFGLLYSVDFLTGVPRALAIIAFVAAIYMIGYFKGVDGGSES